MTTRFGRVLQAGAEVTQSQDRAQELSDFVEKCPLLDGQLIEDIGILARSGGIRDKSGRLTKNNKNSANYWSRKILWDA